MVLSIPTSPSVAAQTLNARLIDPIKTIQRLDSRSSTLLPPAAYELTKPARLSRLLSGDSAADRVPAMGRKTWSYSHNLDSHHRLSIIVPGGAVVFAVFMIQYRQHKRMLPFSGKPVGRGWCAGPCARPEVIGLATPDPQDYYTILGVDQGSSTTDIKEAFRERIKDYVDVYRGVAPADVVEEAQALLEAYRMLTDPECRRKYDAGNLNDPFKAPEAEATELFVDPWTCSGVNPLDWELLQDLARDALARGVAPEEAIAREGAFCPAGAVVWLTPEQYRMVLQEMQEMDDDWAYDWHEAQVQALLGLARRANRQGPA